MCRCCWGRGGIRLIGGAEEGFWIGLAGRGGGIRDKERWWHSTCNVKRSAMNDGEDGRSLDKTLKIIQGQ